MFLAKHSPIIDYHGNNEWRILKLLILKDDLYNGLKSRKVSLRSAEPFLPPPPPPQSQIGLR